VILWWAVPAVAGVATTVWLTGSALASWREQRAGLVYELTPRYRGTAVRAVGAVAAVGCVLASGTWMALGQRSDRPAVGHRALRVVGAAQVTPLRPGRSPITASATAGPRAGAPVAPGSAASAPVGAASPTTSLVTVGRPAGGELLEGRLAGLPGRYRVWLPPQYPGRAAPMQAVLVLAGGPELGSVFQGLAGAVSAGRANPFVAVAPEATCAPAGTIAPAVPAPDLRRAVAARFHVLPGAGDWGVLGLDTGAPCAVTAELDGASGYRAAAALGGRYDALPAAATAALPSGALPGGAPPAAASPNAPSPAPASVRLLLAEPKRDIVGQASAARLSAKLSRRPHADVRSSAAVRDFSAELERFRLVRLAAVYLTEQLAPVRP
jgi:hypothetical protein